MTKSHINTLDHRGIPDTTSEAKLVRDAFEGNVDAFTQLVERYQGPVYNLCYRYVRGPEAEDLAQETFIRAFVHRERFNLEKPILPWLLTLTRNLCIDRLRKDKKALVSNRDYEHIPDRLPSAEESMASKEALSLLAQGLRELPEGSREAIALFHLEGLSYKQVAETLDVPVGTVMTWLHRGRAKLKALLREPVGAPAPLKQKGA